MQMYDQQDPLLTLIAQAIANKVIPLFREMMAETISSIIIPKEREEEELMSVTETLKFLHCSRATLSNWTRDGKIRSHKIGGKLYYKKEVLLKNLQERKFKKQ